MGIEIKKEGILFMIKRVSNKCFLCQILFADSIFLSVFVFEKKGVFLSVGMKVFGVLYARNNDFYYTILDCDVFLGLFFWKKKECLERLLHLILEVKNYVPENFQIQGLYEAFIESTKMMLKNDEKASFFLRKWLKIALN